MPTQRYVNTGSTAGGDGTTNNTSGATRAYESLASWEAAEQASLSDIHNVDLDGSGGDDTTIVLVDGFTTSASNYLKIRGNSSSSSGRHQGKKDTGRYRLRNSASFVSNVLEIRDDHVRLEGFQVELYVGGSSGSTRRAIRHFSLASGAEQYVEKMIISNDHNGGSGSFRGLNSEDSDPTYYYSNNIFWDFNSTNGIGFYMSSGSATGYLYHCTAEDCATGFSTLSSNVVANNCIAQNCTDGWSGTYSGSSDYNISDLASDAPGSNAKNSTTITFTDAANGDHHTTDTDAQVSNNLSGDASYAITDDIDFESRPGSGDVYAGADENVSAATGQPIFKRFGGVPGMGGGSFVGSGGVF